MKLKAIRSHFCDGKVVAVGAVYETDGRTGSMLVAAGKAVPAPVDAPKATPKAAPAKASMTTTSASALVAGAASEPKENHHV